MKALKKRFPEASVVQLKSGGPAMVIEWTREDGYVPVVWFVGDELHRDTFHPDALVTWPILIDLNSELGLK